MILTEEMAQPGVERLDNITEYLNSVVKRQGDIKRDDKNIWRRLHRWTNEDWAEMIIIACAVIEQHPEYVNKDQLTKITKAKRVLETEWDSHPRILDTADYKSTAWGALMSMREVINQVRQDQRINHTALIHQRHKALFE